MKCPFVFSGLGLILFSILVAVAGPAQESDTENGFRALTNKDGRQLQARIKSISKDRRFLLIVLEDGREANIEIVNLILEDQQYLREWYLRQRATEYRLEVAIDKTTARPTERRRGRESKLNTIYPQYEIKVANLDRSALTGARLDYYLLYQNRFAIYRDSETRRWVFSRTDPEENNLVTTYGSHELPELGYNQEAVFLTESASIDQVEVADDVERFTGEDRLLGVMVRITDREKRTLGIWRSSDSGMEEKQWENIAGPEADATTSMGAALGSGRVRRYQKEDRDQFPVSSRPITFFARVLPNREKPDGILGAIGGGETGIVLMLQKGEAIFAVRNEPDKITEVRTNVGPGGAGLLIKATLTKDKISIKAGEQPAVTVASGGLLEREPRLGLSVGFDKDSQVGEGYEAPFRFSGEISEFIVLAGDRDENQ